MNRGFVGMIVAVAAIGGFMFGCEPGVITYAGYAFFALISFFFVRLMLPKTAGRALEDMTGWRRSTLPERTHP